MIFLSADICIYMNPDLANIDSVKYFPRGITAHFFVQEHIVQLVLAGSSLCDAVRAGFGSLPTESYRLFRFLQVEGAPHEEEI